MGYTHYWYREEEIEQKTFDAIVADFEEILKACNALGVYIAGWDGEGTPEINSDAISFNGIRNCGHEHCDIGIAWPAEHAAGIGTDAMQALEGGWFGGAQLNSRTCGGDCSHETCRLERVIDTEERRWQESSRGMYFDCCKTAYKPYDLVVNCLLIIAKHHLKNQITVSSDGTTEQWQDAIDLCHLVLGYGKDFMVR